MKIESVRLSNSSATGLMIAGSVIAYSLGFLLLPPVYGPAFIVLSIVPVILAAALFGMRAGVIVSILGVVLTLLIAAAQGGNQVAVVALHWPVFVLTSIIAMVVGHFRDLQSARDRELAERRRVEHRLHTLNQISQTIVRGGSPEDIARAVVQPVCELLGADCLTLVVNDVDVLGAVRPLAAFNRLSGLLGPEAFLRVDSTQMAQASGEVNGYCPLHQDTTSGVCPDRCGLTMRSTFTEPLTARSTNIGAMTVAARALDHFSPERRAVVREIAAQLAIGIDNAQLQREQQRYVTELEAIRVATLQLTSRLDQEQVLGTILEYALKLMGTDNAHIFLYDGKNLSFGAALWDGVLQPGPLVAPRDDGLTMRVARTKERIVVSNAAVDPAYYRYNFDFHGSIVGTPMLVGEQVIGVMTIAYYEPHEFTTHELRALDLFADHASIAIYNAGLVKQIREHNETLEQHVAERTAALVAVNRSIEALLDSSSDAIVILSADAQVERLNTMARLWFGEVPETFNVNWRRFVNAESQSAVREAFWQVVKSHQPERLEATIRRPDGTQFYTDVALSFDDGDGTSGRVICSLRDISASKASEQSKARLVDGLRAVVNAAYELLDVHTMDELYYRAVASAHEGLGLERCALFVPRDENFYGTYGIDRDGVIVDEHDNQFAISDPYWEARLEKLRQNNSQWITDWAAMVDWRDGRVQELGFESWVAITPLRTPQGMVGVFFNDSGTSGRPQDAVQQELVHLYASLLAHILARKQLEEDLRNALNKEREVNALKSRFVSMVSHEFRTPLAVIQSSGDMLKYYIDRLSPDERKERLELIEAQIRHLTSLLDDILAISRAESVGLDVNRVSVDLVSLCKALVSEFEGTSTLRTITFKTVGTSQRVLVDPKLMRQAISNLLSNAIKYSSNGTPVQVELCFCEDAVNLSVTDFGIGIPLGERDRIFEVFHRAPNADHHSGTGLGLAIVKHVVDLHHGDVTCDSIEGAGTTFRIGLPIQKALPDPYRSPA